eukprot:TRINITY_DN7769_c0_g1_i1.p1 TRINITY_DN7769_c0_g1~~TRINITY_DN7769_c0_g1_i1.p1  ORF type:complete len:520 (-),score=102.96 TRINITY_DN7769_c0_g1_i1:38-1597(-)
MFTEILSYLTGRSNNANGNEKVTYSNGTTPSIVIVGSGISGMCAAIQLKRQLGLTSFTLYSLENEVGGTWMVNVYPGCACDVPSHLYSFSFEPNPNWTEKYSGQREIHKYLIDVAKKHDLYSHIKFRTAITSAIWDSSKNKYHISSKNLDTGLIEESFADILINGGGGLRIPNIPEKFKEFKGPLCHSAQWNPSLDFHDKTVAIIGSGASAIQIIPQLAESVKKLQVYQRTATWVVPRDNYSYPRWLKSLFRVSPFCQRIYRSFIYLNNEITFYAFRRDSYLSPVVSRVASRLAAKNLKNSLPDEDIRNKLTPKYTMGCKRISVSNDYLPSFTRENVSLITEPIEKVDGNTIKTTTQEREADVIILATGFDLLKSVADTKIIGLDGADLQEQWRDCPRAYLGISYDKLPNAFFLVGPNTGLGHNSIIFMIECQVNYIIEAIRTMMKQDKASIVVKPERQISFCEELDEKMQHTVFASGCGSWYQNKLGKVIAMWYGNCTTYWNMTKTFNMNDYFSSSLV